MIFETLLASLFILILGIVIYLLYQNRQKLHKQKNLEEILLKYGKLDHHKKQLLYTVNDDIYEIIFYYIPFNGELTINSKIIWEVRAGYQTRLIDQTTVLSSPYKKICVIYPTQQRLKRFINENELVFINFNDFFNNMYVLLADDLEKLITEALC